MEEGDVAGAQPELVDTLVAMGIDRLLAEQAVIATGNTSAEAAAGWIFENGEDASGLDQERLPPEGAFEAQNNVKMVFVVNTELNMGVGKIASQVAHGCLNLHRFLLQNQETHGHLLLLWESQGETKVVLRGENVTHIEDLRRKAEQANLPWHIVTDAGRTQIPIGSSTVLVIFGRTHQVDQITNQLKLL